MSQTGANADEWVPVKPGTEGVLALGIANAVMKSGVRKPGDAGDAGTLIDSWMTGLTEYTPAEVEKKTGVGAARIERLAKEFAEQRPGVAIIAGPAVAQTNGLFNALAVNALNALMGSVESPGGIWFTPQQQNLGTDSNGERGMGVHARPPFSIGVSPQILFLDGANPVFASPKFWKVKDTIAQVPYIVSFGNFVDETSGMADLLLPDHSFLESWVQSSPESGSKTAVSAVAGPVMRPLHETRATGDVLLEISRKLVKPLELPWKTYEDVVKEPTNPPGKAQETKPPAQGHAAKYSEPQFDGDPGQYAFHFLPYPSIALLDGSLAHLPLLQELPDPMSSAVWSSWVEINLQTADKMGIKQGDLVEITSSGGSIRVPAFPSPGIAPDVIAMPAGQGHENYTRYATGRGASPFEILAPVQEPDTGALAWAATRVKVAKVAEADGRLVLFAGSLRDYPPEGMHR
jgi:anaerobic selenocysteine-containing dehydrogenase